MLTGWGGGGGSRGLAFRHDRAGSRHRNVFCKDFFVHVQNEYLPLEQEPVRPKKG